LTLTVLRNAKTGDLQGSGNAGCNNWTATVILREDQIDFANIASTKKSCGKPQMTAEDAFLTSLRSAKRWRMDGDKFIIEGDAARLMLRGGADKPPASKR
jgi:heat shock protein HslJ